MRYVPSVGCGVSCVLSASVFGGRKVGEGGVKDCGWVWVLLSCGLRCETCGCAFLCGKSGLFYA